MTVGRVGWQEEAGVAGGRLAGGRGLWQEQVGVAVGRLRWPEAGWGGESRLEWQEAGWGHRDTHQTSPRAAPAARNIQGDARVTSGCPVALPAPQAALSLSSLLAAGAAVPPCQRARWLRDAGQGGPQGLCSCCRTLCSSGL